MTFTNCYDDKTRADAYAQLEFANTYYLAYRDLPKILREHVAGTRALDFGCGTGRSTRFAQGLGFNVTGVDIAGEMIGKAKELDAAGDYRLVKDGDLSGLEGQTFDLVLCLFTFDNVPGFETKLRLFRELGRLLKSAGKIVNVVSSPEIYLHEWASFSTKSYPENRAAKSGDVVRIITKDFADSRPMEDILWTDESYRDVYRHSGLEIVSTYKPLANGHEPYSWINETKTAPWVIYVLRNFPAAS